MKLLVEGLAADFGGIRTYVENLLSAWSATFPDDELLIVVRPGSTLDTGAHDRHELPVARPAALGRPLAQTLHIRGIAADFGADAVLATLPSTGLRSPGVPLAVVVHDLRHELRPDQFAKGRRLLRRLSYSSAYALADGIIAVSRRSLDDLHRLHPRIARKPAAVVHHGADHALAWAGTRGSGRAVTFAHHSNKNPELALAAWADGVGRGIDMPPLVILGTGPAREHLEARIRELGLADLVTAAPFLPDEEFGRLMRSASMVVFPSDFEGFGLPVVEGMILGIPVVIGPDPATLEIAGGLAAVARDWTPTALADAVEEAARFEPEHLERARAHAARFTWKRCAQQTRAMLAGVAAAGANPAHER